MRIKSWELNHLFIYTITISLNLRMKWIRINVKGRQNIFVDLNFSKDMFNIIDKTTHKFEIINAPTSLLLETITCNKTPYQYCIFQNKIYYLLVTKIAGLNYEPHTYHSNLFNKEKNNLSHIFLKIFLLVILLNVILPKRYNCRIMKIVIIEFN